MNSSVYNDDYRENCLWKDKESLGLLEAIFGKKRVKAQFFHDNSEDAVTWNVFRFLERNHLVEGFLSLITGSDFRSSEIVYWSYSQEEKNTWSWLDKARKEFGEEVERGSEPDVIIKTDKALFFIEAKLTSGNNTPSRDKIEEKIRNPKKYETGENNWFGAVFESSYEEIIKRQKYELMRFWLLGTWMAKELGLDFWLVNLVLKGEEEGIEAAFKKHIKEGPNRQFKRVTWEEICEFISTRKSEDGEAMLGFFENKTLGYAGRRLKRAFSIIS
jgi:hypothetical protein